MKKPTRRDALLATAAIGAVAATRAKAQTTLALENTPMSDVIQALANGRVTATALTKGYLARIEAYDGDGPKLNSVREINADALTIAGKLDDAKPSVEQPLAGVPILVKDNIATGDKQPTTAGSLALEGARARGDAIVVRLLRDAGMAILNGLTVHEKAALRYDWKRWARPEQLEPLGPLVDLADRCGARAWKTPAAARPGAISNARPVRKVLGDKPRALVTTTSRPIPIIRRRRLRRRNVGS
jgi:hypothetical protein